MRVVVELKDMVVLSVMALDLLAIQLGLTG